MHADTALEGEQRFAIGRAAELCGTTPSTLRSWERRYGFPSPPRRGSGHRIYTRHEVDAIRAVVDRTRRGDAVSLAIEDVRRTIGGSPPLAARRPADLAESYVAAVQALDSGGAAELLRQAWELLDWETLASELIVPAMREIGSRWQAGRLSVAAEHLASAQLRGQVLALIRLLGDGRGGPLAVCGCVPDEQHDIGLLLQSVELRRRGWNVLYLGPAVPIAALVDTVAVTRPHAVFLSTTTTTTAAALPALTDAVRQADSSLAIVVGGQAAPEYEPQAVAALLDRLESAWRGERLVGAPYGRTR